MMNENNLEDFEFEKDVVIRKAAEDKKKPPRRRRPGTPKPSNWIYVSVLFIIFTLVLATLLFQRHNLFKQAVEQNNLQKQTIQSLTVNLETKTNELEAISKQLNITSDKLKESSKGKESILKSIDELNSKLAKEKSDSLKLRKEIDNLKKKRKSLQDDLNKEKEKTSSLKKENSSLVSDKNKLLSSINTLENNNKIFQKELKTLQSEREDENSATIKLIAKMREKENLLQSSDSKLQEQIQLVKQLRQEIKSLKEVEFGELVPVSQMVTQAKAIVHPDVIMEKQGLFSKVEGYVLVNALINETGVVENANYVEMKINGEADKGVIINKALTTIMKWKFSPALYDEHIKVKVWQNVMVPVSSEK